MEKEMGQKTALQTILQAEGWTRVSIDRMYSDTPKPDGWFMADVFLLDSLSFQKIEGIIPASQKGLRSYFRRNSKMLFQFGNVERYDAVHITAMHACPVRGEIKSMLLKCPGVGPVTADKVLSVFGSDTLFVIDEHPELFDDIISEKCRMSIVTTMASLSNRDRFRAMVPKEILPEWKLTILYGYLGETILDVFSKNPYEVLTEDIEEDGIHFLDIDRVACHLCPDLFTQPDKISFRLQHAVRYFVRDCLKQNGDTCFFLDGFEGSAPFDLAMEDLADRFNAFYDGAQMPRMTGSVFYSWCSYEKTKLQFVPYPDGMHTCLYERSVLFLEKSTASFFRRLSHEKVDPAISPAAVQRGIADYESASGKHLAEEQKKAVAGSLSSRLSAVTGVPGSGKTTSAACILDIWNRLTRKQVFLMAPTGLAVKRLVDATSHTNVSCLSGTIDHYLTKASVSKEQGDDPALWFWGRLVIVDETSMLELSKAYRLMGLLQKAHVVFLGDVDQLPSIGIGTVFSDLIASGICPVSRLTVNHRSHQCAALGEAASLIRRKVEFGPAWHPVLNGSLDWSFFGKDVDCYDTEELWGWYEPVFRMTGSLKEIAVLSPTKDVVKAVSFALQDKLNPEQKTVPFDREGSFKIYDTKGVPIQKCFCYQGDPSKRLLRVGDRAMFRKNIPDYGLVNGDMGFILSYTEDQSETGDHKLYFETDGGTRAEIACEDFRYLEPGYAVSVHKAQGCEYKRVFLVLKNLTWDVSGHFANRNLIYTAITRAKERCMVFGHTGSFWHCIKQDMYPRCGMLRERLQGIM